MVTKVQPKHYAPENFCGVWKLKIKRNRVELVNTKTGQRGTSYCHPDDDFDIRDGIMYALVRAMVPFKLNRPYLLSELNLDTRTGLPGITLTGEDGATYTFTAKKVTRRGSGVF